MMPETLLLLVGLVCAYAGMAFIALGNAVHWGAVVHRPSSSGMITRRQQWIGSALLLSSATSAIIRDGWGFGTILTALLVASGGGLVIATLTLKPTLLRVFAIGRNATIVQAGSDSQRA